ncbi:MAG: TraX family protein, partial [Patescibacteria group bacterium]
MNKPLSLSSTGLKLIAMATMFVDHVGLLFFPEEFLFRLVGRISFPIFAFLIAEGFEKTSHIWKYLYRLLAFAALSQIPYSLFMQTSGASLIRLNIFFTLAGGLLALILLRKVRAAYAALGILLIAVIAKYALFDYGIYGILAVLGSSLFLHFRSAGIAVLLGLPFLRVVATLFSSSPSLLQGYATLSVPFIMLYDGTHGRRLPRIYFYLFYPAHLLVLALIWFLIH